MTTIPFKPNPHAPFTFTATVGGQSVFGAVIYNLYARRYYLKLTGGNNQPLVYVPLIASSDDYDVNLALPLAPGTLIYRASTRNFEAS
ncbi:hypothetical protein [Serratia fonticola]|uniref:hypothetical protein n=1 Tax=Serratia fonticola TaxID=47917 RepID=UPI00301CBB0C